VVGGRDEVVASLLYASPLWLGVTAKRRTAAGTALRGMVQCNSPVHGATET